MKCSSMTKISFLEKDLTINVKSRLGILEYPHLIQYTNNGDIFIVDNSVFPKKNYPIKYFLCLINAICIMIVPVLFALLLSYSHISLKEKIQLNNYIITSDSPRWEFLLFFTLSLILAMTIVLINGDHRYVFNIKHLPKSIYRVRNKRSKENKYELSGIIKKGFNQYHNEKARRLVENNETNYLISKKSQQLYKLWIELLIQGEDSLAELMLNIDFYVVYNDPRYEKIRNLIDNLINENKLNDSKNIRDIIGLIPIKNKINY